MGYIAKSANVKKKTYSFTDFRLGGRVANAIDGETLIASEVWNCETGKGLRANYVLQELLEVGSGLGRINFTFTVGKMGAEKIHFLTTSGDCYALENQKSIKKGSGYGGVKVVEFVRSDGTKCAAFCGWSGVTVYDGTAFTKISEEPAYHAVYAAERLFIAGENGIVRYSAPLNESDFTKTADDGGTLTHDFRFGRIIAMKEYDGSVYLFTPFGISRLEARGAARDFTLHNVHYDGKLIYNDTAARGENGVYFLSTDGVYVCAGLTTKKVLDVSNLQIQNSNSNFKAIYADGRYFVCIKLDGFYCSLAVDVQQGAATYLNAWEGMGNGTEYPMFVYGGILGAFYSYRQYAITSNQTFLMGNTFLVPNFEICSAGEQATIERIDLVGRGGLTVTVSNRKTEKTFYRTLEQNEPLYVRLKGNRFSLKFSLDAGTELERVDVSVEKLKK